MDGERRTDRIELTPARRALRGAAAAVLTLVVLTAVAGCGRGTWYVWPTGGGGTGSPGSGAGNGGGGGAGTGTGYSGPAAANADVLSFQTHLWTNISGADRCGGCHKVGGDPPLFARADDINLAYQATGPLVSFSDPAQSELVLKVGGGHNCFLASPQDCAAAMTTWIRNWIGATSGLAAGIALVPPPDQSVGGRRLFAVDAGKIHVLG